MKRISLLLLICILCTAFKCDNEPLEGEFVTEQEASCDIAIQNVIDAALAFSQANDNTYESLCIAYKNALQFQIQFCGDPDGSLQALIDSLGNCSSIVEVTNCDEAIAAAQLAQEAFENATSETYTELCNDYRLSLLTLMELCGSDEDTIAILQDLGNCIEEIVTGEGFISVNTGSAPLVFDIINVFQNGNTLQVAAETGSPTYYIIYFEIELGATGDNLINDSFSMLITSQFYPSTQGFDDFTSTITTNTPGNIIGTFSGIVSNESGGDLNLTSGVISVAY